MAQWPPAMADLQQHSRLCMPAGGVAASEALQDGWRTLSNIYNDTRTRMVEGGWTPTVAPVDASACEGLERDSVKSLAEMYVKKPERKPAECALQQDLLLQSEVLPRSAPSHLTMPSPFPLHSNAVPPLLPSFSAPLMPPPPPPQQHDTALVAVPVSDAVVHEKGTWSLLEGAGQTRQHVKQKELEQQDSSSQTSSSSSSTSSSSDNLPVLPDDLPVIPDNLPVLPDDPPVAAEDRSPTPVSEELTPLQPTAEGRAKLKANPIFQRAMAKRLQEDVSTAAVEPSMERKRAPLRLPPIAVKLVTEVDDSKQAEDLPSEHIPEPSATVSHVSQEEIEEVEKWKEELEEKEEVAEMELVQSEQKKVCMKWDEDKRRTEEIEQKEEEHRKQESQQREEEEHRKQVELERQQGEELLKKQEAERQEKELEKRRREIEERERQLQNKQAERERWEQEQRRNEQAIREEREKQRRLREQEEKQREAEEQKEKARKEKQKEKKRPEKKAKAITEVIEPDRKRVVQFRDAGAPRKKPRHDPVLELFGEKKQKVVKTDPNGMYTTFCRELMLKQSSNSSKLLFLASQWHPSTANLNIITSSSPDLPSAMKSLTEKLGPPHEIVVAYTPVGERLVLMAEKALDDCDIVKAADRMIQASDLLFREQNNAPKWHILAKRLSMFVSKCQAAASARKKAQVRRLLHVLKCCEMYCRLQKVRLYSAQLNAAAANTPVAKAFIVESSDAGNVGYDMAKIFSYIEHLPAAEHEFSFAETSPYSKKSLFAVTNHDLLSWAYRALTQSAVASS